MAGRDVQKGTYAVIMAGGRGERLCPWSTPEKPKQFLKLVGKRTMLQEAVDRISPLIPLEEIYVVVPKELAHLAREQLELPKENILSEPMGKNTAPCLGLVAVVLRAKDPEVVMVALPADHVIQKREAFLKVLKAAADVARKGKHLITLGITLNYPATGYGYIRKGKLFTSLRGVEVYKAQGFTEKPALAKAQEFLASGEYLWNSGMFVWQADTFLEAVAEHMPELYAGLCELEAHLGQPDWAETLKRVYASLPSVSVDYGVMEKAENVLVIPADIGWSDLGDWVSLGALLPKDLNENALHARHIGLDTKGCVIYAEDPARLAATLGIEGLVIVETKEALLIIPKERVQEVRRILELLRKTGSAG